jgi:hypothetical protein
VRATFHSIGITLAALAAMSAGADATVGGALSAAQPLQLRPKSAIQSVPAPSQNAPFVAVPGERELELQPRSGDARLQEIRANCDTTTRQLCYDTGTGKVVYKKTREYMPSIPGLTAEHIAVRRDRVTFKYSFQ